MMAETVTIPFVDEDGWGDYAAYVYDITKTDGSEWVTDKWPGQKAAATDIEEVNYKGKKVKVVTWKIDLKECAAGNAYVLFNNNKYNNKEEKYPSSGGWVVNDGHYYYKDGTSSTTPPSEGSGSGSETTYPTISVKSNYGQNWDFNKKFNFTTTDGIIYTCELKDVPANETVYFRIVKNDKEWGPNTGSNLELTNEYQTIYQVDNSSVSLQIGPSSVQSTYTITYDSGNNRIKCTSTSGSGTGGSATVEWNTVTTNRLTDKPRVYTKGFYLAGDFFTFDTEGINYNDAVFKFQQQNDQSIREAATSPYDVYMVEIPASLTAHAQVMYVDETGEKTGIFGPGTANKTIDKGFPATGQSTEWAGITPNESTNLLDNTQNYWDFSTRNVSESEYSDGLYEVYIAVDKNTHEPAKWMIKHIADKRVAYFISDTPDATAMPLYDTYKENTTQFGDKFFASVNLAAERSYYVISNYVMRNGEDYIKHTRPLYGTLAPDGNRVNCPTTNKLFLLGNGGYCVETADDHNQFSPNEKPMKPSDNQLGTLIVEYNCSNGKDEAAKSEKHLGFRGQVIIHEEMRTKLTSVSLVGDAIPGTTNADGTWNYKSNVSDMVYDETEQCYKARVVTTAECYGKPFRFVGNRDQIITWYENTNTDRNEMAKYPLDSESALGHTADANDPNQVNYTEKGENPGEDWNIIWNRPAGRWTVRLYFYTYSDGNDPKTDYYYTITESRDMELHDVKDVVYGYSDNKQIITNLGDYKFMRTWSAQKAWRISDKVDIFVVSDIKDEGSVVKMTLTNINDYVSKDERVIPPNTGVILATKSDASEISGAQFKSRQNFTSYNNLVIPMEQYSTDKEYPKKNNKLEPILVSHVISPSDADNYNYLFGYYNAQIATGDKKYGANDYLLGFWISKGSKPYPSNSSYLPIDKVTAEKMNRLGTSYDDFRPAVSSAKKVPGVIFDFDNVGGPTGINEVVNQSTKLNNGKYYTLSGQQVEKPTAGGIYIRNGRKFVVK